MSREQAVGALAAVVLLDSATKGRAPPDDPLEVRGPACACLAMSAPTREPRSAALEQLERAPSSDRPCQVPSLFLLAGEAVALTAGRSSRTPADSKFAEMWGGSAAVAALRKHREARAKAKPK